MLIKTIAELLDARRDFVEKHLLLASIALYDVLFVGQRKRMEARASIWKKQKSRGAGVLGGYIHKHKVYIEDFHTIRTRE